LLGHFMLIQFVTTYKIWIAIAACSALFASLRVQGAVAPADPYAEHPIVPGNPVRPAPSSR